MDTCDHIDHKKKRLTDAVLEDLVTDLIDLVDSYEARIKENLKFRLYSVYDMQDSQIPEQDLQDATQLLREIRNKIRCFNTSLPQTKT